MRREAAPTGDLRLSGVEVMDGRCGEEPGRALGGAEACFELIAEGHEGVDRGNDKSHATGRDPHPLSTNQYRVPRRAPVFSTSGCAARRFATVCQFAPVSPATWSRNSALAIPSPGFDRR